MMGYGWGMGLAGWIFIGLFWIAVVALVVWAAIALLPGSRRHAQAGLETPEEILRRRFALGEVDAERHRQMREELAGNRSGRRGRRLIRQRFALLIVAVVALAGVLTVGVWASMRMSAGPIPPRDGRRARCRHDGRLPGIRHDGRGHDGPRVCTAGQRPAGWTR